MAIFLKVRFLGHSAYILKHSKKVVLVGVHVHTYIIIHEAGLRSRIIK